MFQESFYWLEDGVAMGSSVSSVMANIIMQHFEEAALRTNAVYKPRIWCRNVDDVFSVIKLSGVLEKKSNTSTV